MPVDAVFLFNCRQQSGIAAFRLLTRIDADGRHRLGEISGRRRSKFRLSRGQLQNGGIGIGHAGKGRVKKRAGNAGRFHPRPERLDEAFKFCIRLGHCGEQWRGNEQCSEKSFEHMNRP